MYDEVAGQVDFAEFNEQWIADELDTGSPTAQALQSAATTCSLGAASG